MKIDFSQMANGYTEYATDEPQPSALIDEPKPYQPVKAYDPLDIKRAKKTLCAYKDACKRERIDANACFIRTDADEAEASTRMLADVKLFKKIDALRMSLTEAARAFVADTNAFMKTFSDHLSEKKNRTGAIEILDAKITAYATQKEFTRRKKEKEAQDAVKKLQDEHNKEAEKIGVDPVTLPTPVIPRGLGPVRTPQGTVSIKMVWRHRVIDVEKVPRQYLMINDSEIKKAITAGIREIPGIEIYDGAKTHKRTA